MEPDEEVQQLAGYRCAEFGQSLGGDDGGEASLAAAAAQVGQGRYAEPPGFGVLSAAREMRCEQVTLVDADEHRVRP